MSNQLKSNLCSPALEQALTSLSKLSKAKEEQMNEEIALEGELDRELTDYLICNKELLMEINTKITNIAEIKEGFGRSVFSQKVALDNLKTPSKGEREQY